MCPRCSELCRAEFEPFVEHYDGRRHFANEVRGAGRFRERVYPVLSNSRRQRRKRLPMFSVCVVKVSRSIEQSARLSEARRWLPCNPLVAFAMRAEDARRAC
jgi:hypothetical protein